MTTVRCGQTVEGLFDARFTCTHLAGHEGYHEDNSGEHPVRWTLSAFFGKEDGPPPRLITDAETEGPSLQERQVKALESIAASLEKMSNPMLMMPPPPPGWQPPSMLEPHQGSPR